MAEEAKDKSESQEENQSEKEDNRLPYEPPKLRKHGKVNDTTLVDSKVVSIILLVSQQVI